MTLTPEQLEYMKTPEFMENMMAQAKVREDAWKEKIATKHYGAAITIRCPKCQAPAGELCSKRFYSDRVGKWLNGSWLTMPHKKRAGDARKRLKGRM